MRDVLNRICKDPMLKLGAVLHVGAGTASELEHYQQHNADKVMLVEANPALADRLRQKAREAGNVEVIPAAVSTTSGETWSHEARDSRAGVVQNQGVETSYQVHECGTKLRLQGW